MEIGKRPGTSLLVPVPEKNGESGRSSAPKVDRVATYFASPSWMRSVRIALARVWVVPASVAAAGSWYCTSEGVLVALGGDQPASSCTQPGGSKGNRPARKG